MANSTVVAQIPNTTGFNSVFQNMASGKFNGTANGVLLFKDFNQKEVILDFQGSSANLFLETTTDTDTYYDVSHKVYTAYTTSGKTKIEYRIYSSANALAISYNNQLFAISLIDGACESVIDGLSYKYMLEKDTEYLILNVRKQVKLSNTFYLSVEEIKAEKKRADYKELKAKERFIYLQPGSVLVFAIKRK